MTHVVLPEFREVVAEFSGGGHAYPAHDPVMHPVQPHVYHLLPQMMCNINLCILLRLF